MNSQPNGIYTTITNHVIIQLENQNIPWRKPWTDAGHPQNLFTKRLYTGINAWLLGSLGYSQNYFLTWRQLRSVGGKVKQGEKHHMILYWRRIEPPYKAYSSDDIRSTIVPEYYWVYNIDQCDGLLEVPEIPFPSGPTLKLAACEGIIDRMPNCPTIKHGKQQAFYDPFKDCISIPKQGAFASLESYYCNLYQQLIYATGHKSRLNRIATTDNDAIESLIGEIGTGYLNSITGNVDKQFVHGIGSCDELIAQIRANDHLIVEASTQAYKATNYILNFQMARYRTDVQELSEIETL